MHGRRYVRRRSPDPYCKSGLLARLKLGNSHKNERWPRTAPGRATAQPRGAWSSGISSASSGRPSARRVPMSGTRSAASNRSAVEPARLVAALRRSDAELAGQLRGSGRGRRRIQTYELQFVPGLLRTYCWAVRQAPRAHHPAEHHSADRFGWTSPATPPRARSRCSASPSRSCPRSPTSSTSAVRSTWRSSTTSRLQPGAGPARGRRGAAGSHPDSCC